MYEIDMDIYRHLRAMENLVDMRFPYYMEHFPEEEISDEDRKEIHMIIDEMKRGKEYRLEDTLVEIRDIKDRLRKVESRISL